MALPVLALVLGGIATGAAVYSAMEATKARKDAERQQRAALKQQAADAAAFRGELSLQTAEFAKQGASLAEQAKLARESFNAQQEQYQEARLEMQTKAKEVQDAIDEERRKAAASDASAIRARTRGGRRALLSQERLTPELGIMSPQLSPGMTMVPAS
jgi:hypothetical protein